MEWINVLDRMPVLKEEGTDDFRYLTSGRILLFDKNSGSTCIGMFEKGEDWESWRIDDEGDIYILESVTHWMPLPINPQ